MSYVDPIVEVLTARRKELGLSQRETAERAHMKQSQISELEAGKHDVGLRVLRRLCDALGVRLVTIVDEVDS